MVYGPDRTAELLGLRPTTLASRIKKFSLFAYEQTPCLTYRALGTALDEAVLFLFVTAEFG